MAPKIDVASCERLLTAATTHCQASCPAPCPPAPTLPAPAGGPDWGAIGTSLSELSIALTWGAIVFAGLVAVVGVAWGVILKRQIEKEAREEARAAALKFAEAEISSWLAKNAAEHIRKHVELLTLGQQNTAADEIGNQA